MYDDYTVRDATHTYIYETDAACSTDGQVLEPMNLHDGITSWVFIDTTLP